MYNTLHSTVVLLKAKDWFSDSLDTVNFTFYCSSIKSRAF